MLRFGEPFHPDSLSRVVRRLGFSRQKARPSHSKQNPAEAEAFKRSCGAAARKKRIRLFFQDEARIGQNGRVCHVWWTRGERAPGFCDKRFTFAYAELSHCCPHGLRKAAARRLAEAGCSTHQIRAITGHATLKEVERYTKAADQKRLAEQAIEKLKGTQTEQKT